MECPLSYIPSGWNAKPIPLGLCEVTAGLILEIFQYIRPKGTYFVAPAVKIFACLDLEQNISFLNGH